MLDVIGHMLGDFFGYPVAVDALGSDDQGKVYEPRLVQHAHVVDQNL